MTSNNVTSRTNRLLCVLACLSVCLSMAVILLPADYMSCSMSLTVRRVTCMRASPTLAGSRATPT